MCIVLLTTAHPAYALIVIDNRDEFILRPTSRPHWWTLPNGTRVLSSRDLQRAEKGTWLGITKEGTFAVLTNYRELDVNDVAHPVHGLRSRGAMVTKWLGCDPTESVKDSVHEMVKDGGVKGVGGFSMVCGKLRKKKGDGLLERIAIVSNRNEHVDQVSWVCNGPGEVCALSNTRFEGNTEANPSAGDKWPKLETGKRLLRSAVEKAVAEGADEDGLVDMLYQVLDSDTLPQHPNMSLSDYVAELKHSVFIPPIGDKHHREDMEAARAKGRGEWASDDQKAVEEEMEAKGILDPSKNNLGFETGMYGTQRQTIVLVGWDGQVSYRERALYDSNGNAVPRGEGDVLLRFHVEGWAE